MGGIVMSFPRFDAPVFVSADRTRLKQIVINLVSNAIKYNTEKGTVVVECNAKDPFSVPDTKVFVEVPKNSQYLTVQLTFKDGTKSEAIRFDR